MTKVAESPDRSTYERWQRLLEAEAPVCLLARFTILAFNRDSFRKRIPWIGYFERDGSMLRP